MPYQDRKSTRLNSSHGSISYAVFCLKKKKKTPQSFTSGQPSLPVSATRPCLYAAGGHVGGARSPGDGAPCLHRRFFFFFNDTATTEIYTLSLHDALPI